MRNYECEWDGKKGEWVLVDRFKKRECGRVSNTDLVRIARGMKEPENKLNLVSRMCAYMYMVGRFGK